MWSKMVGGFIDKNSLIALSIGRGSKLCWRATCQQ
jgi:hypothetical protein